jgi:hypothetical protein
VFVSGGGRDYFWKIENNMKKSDTYKIVRYTTMPEVGDHCANIAGTCEPRDTRLTQRRSLSVLATLASRYESADDYNRPAIEFVLRRVFRCVRC